MQQRAGQCVFFVAAQEDAQYHEECNILEEMRNSYSPAHEKTMRTAELLEIIRNGGLHTETLPVAGTSIDSLDLDRLNFYLASIIEDPDLPSSREQWIERLLGLGLMAEDGLGNKVCSIAGLVCFGIRPRRYLPQAGLRLMVFDGKDKEYQARLDTVLDGPLAGRWRMIAGQRELVDRGVIEQFAAAIQPFISCEEADVDETMRRGKEFFYPWQAVRETVINALAHRDWSRSVDIEVSGYADRLEVISPGALQNSMTVAKMIAGQRSPRNPLIMEILRDYGYVDARGMGVRTKVIPLMRQHNGAEPIFEASEDYLKIVLPKRKVS